jgi:hypothetical protein
LYEQKNSQKFRKAYEYLESTIGALFECFSSDSHGCPKYFTSPTTGLSASEYLSSMLYSSECFYPETYDSGMYGRACVSQYVRSERMATNYLHFVETMIESNSPLLYMFVYLLVCLIMNMENYMLFFLIFFCFVLFFLLVMKKGLILTCF